MIVVPVLLAVGLISSLPLMLLLAVTAPIASLALIALVRRRHRQAAA